MTQTPPATHEGSNTNAGQQHTENKFRIPKCLKRPTIANWIEAACAVSLVVITGCYTHYAGGQLGIMGEQLGATKRQLADIEKAQGAALFVDVKFSADWQLIVFSVTNHGQVAAKNAVICGAVWVRTPENQIVSRNYRLGGDNSAIPPSRAPYPFGKLPLSPRVAKGLQDHIAGLGVGGAVAFDTGFNNVRGRQNLCLNFESGEWSTCPTWDNPISLAKETGHMPADIPTLKDIADNCK